jgi:hypothetical protein
MLPGNEIAFLDRALFCKTPQAFQEEFLPFPSAQPANCFTMSCQVLSPLSQLRNFPESLSLALDAAALGRSAAVVRHRRHVLDRVDVQA